MKNDPSKVLRFTINMLDETYEFYSKILTEEKKEIINITVNLSHSSLCTQNLNFLKFIIPEIDR